MKHVIRQFNITEDTDYAAYQELMNDEFFQFISESSEFSREGNYILLVHGKMSPVPVKHPGEVNSIELLNMGIRNERERLEKLYEEHKVNKEVLNFNKKTNGFQVAVHWVDQCGDKAYNNKVYRLED